MTLDVVSNATGEKVLARLQLDSNLSEKLRPALPRVTRLAEGGLLLIAVGSEGSSEALHVESVDAVETLLGAQRCIDLALRALTQVSGQNLAEGEVRA